MLLWYRNLMCMIQYFIPCILIGGAYTRWVSGVSVLMWRGDACQYLPWFGRSNISLSEAVLILFFHPSVATLNIKDWKYQKIQDCCCMMATETFNQRKSSNSHYTEPILKTLYYSFVFLLMRISLYLSCNWWKIVLKWKYKNKTFRQADGFFICTVLKGRVWKR